MRYYLSTIWFVCLICVGLIKLMLKYELIKVKKYYIFMVIADTFLLTIVPFVFTRGVFVEQLLFLLIIMSVINSVISLVFIRINTKKQGQTDLKRAKISSFLKKE